MVSRAESVVTTAEASSLVKLEASPSGRAVLGSGCVTSLSDWHLLYSSSSEKDVEGLLESSWDVQKVSPALQRETRIVKIQKNITGFCSVQAAWIGIGELLSKPPLC